MFANFLSHYTGEDMKHIAVIAFALAISGGTASASGLTDPVIEQEIIIEEAKAASSSSATAIVLLTGLLMLAVVAQ